MKAVLFDMDGVVVQSMEDHFEGWRKALADYGIEVMPEELYIIEGSGGQEIASQFTRKFNLPFDEADNIFRKKDEYYQEIKNTALYPNFFEIVRWVKEKELKTGLVTGGERPRVIDTLSELELSEQFDVVVTASDVRFTKPSPEPYLRAVADLQVEAEDAVVLENAPLGIRAARAAGMRCVAVSTTLPVKYLKEADVVTDNLYEALDALKRMY